MSEYCRLRCRGLETALCGAESKPKDSKELGGRVKSLVDSRPGGDSGELTELTSGVLSSSETCSTVGAVTRKTGAIPVILADNPP